MDTNSIIKILGVLLTALASMGMCQIAKAIYYAVKKRKFTLEGFFVSGGFPSSHSAFCISLITSMALVQIFIDKALNYSLPVAFVFACIIIHDALGVRMEAQKHAKLLNKMAEQLNDEQKAQIGYESTLKEHIGHRLIEVIVGIVIGLFTGLLGFIVIKYGFSL